MWIIIEEQTINEIPVLNVYNPNSMEKLPIIMILHGFSGCKESNLQDAYRFAKEGYYVVSFDAFRHGELMDDEFKRLSKLERSRDFWNITLKTTQIINPLIDSYQANEKADYRRVGLLGRSMGGVIIYNYLTGNRHPNLKAAVPMIATPSWVSLEREYFKINEAARQYYNEAESKRIAEIEPYRKLHLVKDFPLLMLNGVNDPEMPIMEVRRSFFEMRQRYGNKELIQLMEYEVGHQVTGEMIDQALDWFKKYL